MPLIRSLSLFLIGPRGAGKSAAGALAAAAAGCPFVDTDSQVERRAGQSVARIFAERGEQAFRALERQVILELLDPTTPPGLVATGGGCVIDPILREGLQRQPGVLWLQCLPEVLRARIAGSDRPSLTGGDPGEELATLIAERRPHYAACARRTLDTTTLSVEEAADAVQHIWTELSSHDLR